MDIDKRSRRIATFIWLFVIVISLLFIRSNLSVVSDIQQFMPGNASDQRLQVLLHETQNSSATNLILVQLEGAPPAHLARLSQKLKFTLEKNSGIFESVINGDQNFDPDSFKTLMEHRYLLNQPGDFSVAGLQVAFTDILQAFAGGATDKIIEYLLLDPHKTFLRYLTEQAGQLKIDKALGVWFNAEQSKALLVIQLRSSGYDLDFIQRGISAIQNTTRELDNSGDIKLKLSGPGVFAVTTRSSIQQTIQWISWTLATLVLALFWYGYRSIRLALIAGIPLLTSILVAISITQLVFGSVHGIVLAFGITMLGVCIDYPLHLFSHLQQQESAKTTLNRIWPTLRLGALTSVVAYLALTGTGYSGLTQLAIFAATGLVVSLVVTRCLIPYWVDAAWIEKRPVSVATPLPRHLKIFVSIGCIGVSLIILSVQDNIWSRDISQISPVPDAAMKLDRELRLALHATDVSHLFLIDGKSVNEVLVKTEDLKLAMQPAIESGILSGVNTVSDILPSTERQQYYQSLLPEKSTLLKNVSTALEDLTFTDTAFNHFMSAVTSSKTKPTVTYETIAASPLGPKLQSMLFQKADQWYSLIRLTGVKSEEDFASWIKASADNIEPYYLSLHDATNILMNDYLESARNRLLGILVFLTIIVAALTLKRKTAIWTLVPVIAGVVVSLAVQTLLGNLINIFHVLSLLLVIGMGFDYSLFFNREWTRPDQLQDRTHAVLISTITTVVSFGVLGLSDVPILAAMGQTVSVGILTCFILAQRISVPEESHEEYQNS